MTTAKERSAPASVGEFRDRLVLLYQRSGSPSHSALCKAALAHQAPQLAKATLSDFLRNKYPGRLPRQDFVRALLVGCLGAAGAVPAEISAELERWDGWWGALVVASGSPPTTGAVQIPSAAPEPALRPRPVTADRVGGSRWRTAAVGAGCALAGAGATMGVLALAEPSSDPSLMYGPCAEAIDHSGQVGSVALLADTGPHGRPVQDRTIELRVQKHPQQGWVAWAYLAKSPSDLDRLWLDWSYYEKPADQSQWRQCGAQTVTVARYTPAMLVSDQAGRQRWFRACGQVTKDFRAPDHSGTFCTSWTRPLV